MNISKQVLRDALPTPITFKIKNFSVLSVSDSSIKKYESHDFEAGGYHYQWKLLLYPNGNNDEYGGGYVSMYLEILEEQTNSLPRGWVLDVSFRFFLFDQIQDKYLILGDMGGSTKRFHGAKRIWGSSRLLPITTLNNASKTNGYLVDDTCVFGAEVFVCKKYRPTGYEECLTMVKDPTTVSYTWRIESFSKIHRVYVFSELFNAEGYKWKVMLYPKGELEENNRSIAMYLCFPDSETHSSGTKVYARYKLRIRNQITKEHLDWESDGNWFLSGRSWGWMKFVELGEFNNNEMGFLVNDVCIIEADVTVLGVVKKLP